ncbi:MAG: hypothetical protein J6R79_05400 [Bacteroidaceae bacterium]|nr:hypothetical protein [Bacteroidaceae bacterium]
MIDHEREGFQVYPRWGVLKTPRLIISLQPVLFQEPILRTHPLNKIKDCPAEQDRKMQEMEATIKWQAARIKALEAELEKMKKEEENEKHKEEAKQ